MKSNTPNTNPACSSDVFTAFRQIVKTYLSDFVFTADPVKVVEVGADGYLTVRPVVKQETTSGKTLSIGSDNDICNVRPLYFLGGGTELSFEAAAGDYGLLIACKSDVTKYAVLHTEAVGGLRQFSPSNGFFLPIDFSRRKERSSLFRGRERRRKRRPRPLCWTTRESRFRQRGLCRYRRSRRRSRQRKRLRFPQNLLQ